MSSSERKHLLGSAPNATPDVYGSTKSVARADSDDLSKSTSHKARTTVNDFLSTDGLYLENKQNVGKWLLTCEACRHRHHILIKTLCHTDILRLARDHMSNERTMLAYLRTAIAFASGGIGRSSSPTCRFLFGPKSARMCIACSFHGIFQSRSGVSSQ